MMLNTRIDIITLSMLLMLLVSFIPPAYAHAVIVPNKSVIGEEQEYIVAVVGEKEEPTIRIEMIIPKEFRLINVAEVKDWKYEKKIESGVTKLVWISDVGLGLDETVKLRIRLRNPDREGLYKLTVIQAYADGEKATWNFPGTWVRIEKPSIQYILQKNIIYIIAAIVIAAVVLTTLKKRKK